ncbi:MAG TPA: hypothetical protein PKL83_05470 [bacterium]|nr:hypothetical protein [bacterium]
MPIQEHTGDATPRKPLLAPATKRRVLLGTALLTCILFGGLVVPQWYQSYKYRKEELVGYDDRGLKHLAQIEAAITTFYTKNGYYPPSSLISPYIDDSRNFTRSSQNTTVWIPSLATAGSVILQPIDPVNDDIYYYRYMTDKPPAKKYELDCQLSDKNLQQDNGNNPDRYETGTDLTLLP